MFAQLMGLRTISPRDLQRRMQSETVMVLDVNSRTSWLAARVPGARHIDPTRFTASDLPTERSALLVFYCSGPLCRKAPNAAKRAKGLGYANATVMAAGISGWLGAGLAVEVGESGSSTQ